MKPNSLNLFVVLLTLLGAIDALAQGTVYLNNYALSACGTGLKAPVYAPEPGNITLSKTGNTTSGLPAGTQTYSGALLSGSTYRAQLYGAAGYGRLETDLVAATPATTFRTGAAAGYLTAVTATIPGTAEGGSATVQMRAWDNTSGLYPDWASAETAWNLGLIAAGKAPSINVSGLGGVGPAPYLCGLVSFNLYYQPVAPQITAQPADQYPALGQPANFSVTATGSQPLRYQWRFNSNPIDGANDHLYGLMSAQISNSGSYTVVITNTYGSITSQVAYLAIPPWFTLQPVGRTVAVGSNVAFTCMAAGTPPLRYQWQFNGSPIPGATMSGYPINNAQLSHAGTYSVVVTNRGGVLTSVDAVLAVGYAPSISSQPVSKAVPVGQDVLFSVQGSGSTPLSYQWRKNGSPIYHATDTSLSLVYVGTYDAGSYTAVLSNQFGSLTSQVATLTLLPPTNLTWTGSGGTANWSEAANWDPAGRGVGLGDTLLFPDGAAKRVNTNDILVCQLNGLSFPGSTDGYQLWGNSFNVSNFLQSATTGTSNTLKMDVILGVTNVQVDVQTNAQLVLEGALLAQGGFVKTSPGTLTLSGNTDNTYQGPTAVNEGLMELNKNGALAISTGSLTVGDGIGKAEEDVVRSIGGDNQVAATLLVQVSSSGLLDFNNRNDHLGPMILHGGDVKTGAGILRIGGDITAEVVNQKASISGNIVLAQDTTTINVRPEPIVDWLSLAIDANISGSNLVKTGPGVLYIAGTNSLAGLASLQDGTTILGNNWSLGSTAGATIINNNASLALSTGDAVTGERLVISGTRTKDGWAMVANCNQCERGIWDGPIKLDCDAPIYWMALRGPIDGNGSPAFWAPVDGPLYGMCSLDGPLPNTYLGATRAVGGGLLLNKSCFDGAIPHDLYIETNCTVQLLAANQIANSALVDIAAGGILDLNGFGDAIDRLKGSGLIAFGGGGSLSVGGADGSSTFDGVIYGAGSLRKSGTGTFTLTGTNTYTSKTYTDSGMLVVDGYQPQSAVQVAGLGTLRGHGTVGDIIGLGTVAPGLGTLTCSNLALASSARFYAELLGVSPAFYGQLNIRGTCDLGGATLIVADFFSTQGVRIGDQFRIINNDDTDPVLGTFAGRPDGAEFTSADIRFRISYVGGDGNDVVLTALSVPGSAVGTVVTGGNGDHIVNRQECNDLLVSLVNTSSIPMTGISATLSTTTPRALITQPYSVYPDLPPGSMAVNLTPFQLSTLPNLPAGDIDLQLTVKSATHASFTLPLVLTRGTGANSPGNSACYPCLEPLTGTITQANPTEVGRIVATSQPAACGAPKPWPGKTGMPPVGGTYMDFHYAVHTFTNTTGADACVTVELYSAGDLQAVAYLDSFDPVNIEANYLGDGGYNTLAGGGVSTFSCQVPAGARWVVVVNQTVEEAVSMDYGLLLYGLPCGQPVLYAQPAPEDKVRVYWHTGWGGYLLESAPSLTNAPWTPVPEEPIVSDATYNVTNLADQPARFYRLTSTGSSLTNVRGMALIRAGVFTMGNCMDPGEGWSNELPTHDVYISAFYMDRTEVPIELWNTVKDWSAGNGYTYTYAGSGKAANHPVHTVSWYDAVKWCNARSQKEGLTPCYYTDAGLSQVYKTLQIEPYVNWSANGYRLPTEAEWEKAARGGAPGHRFPWSYTENIAHSNANYHVYQSYGTNFYAYDQSPTAGLHPDFDDSPKPYTGPVGHFAPNGHGLYDMAGNVYEWCWDWYDGTYYSSSPTTDPRGPVGPLIVRVSRGGAWNYAAVNARCANRNGGTPTGADYAFGFRCVRGL